VGGSSVRERRVCWPGTARRADHTTRTTAFCREDAPDDLRRRLRSARERDAHGIEHGARSRSPRRRRRFGVDDEIDPVHAKRALFIFGFLFRVFYVAGCCQAPTHGLRMTPVAVARACPP